MITLEQYKSFINLKKQIENRTTDIAVLLNTFDCDFYRKYEISREFKYFIDTIDITSEDYFHGNIYEISFEIPVSYLSMTNEEILKEAQILKDVREEKIKLKKEQEKLLIEENKNKKDF
jgi:hypothetical protein